MTNNLDEAERLAHAAAAQSYPGGVGRGDPGWRFYKEPSEIFFRLCGCFESDGQDYEFAEVHDAHTARYISFMHPDRTRSFVVALRAMERALLDLRSQFYVKGFEECPNKQECLYRTEHAVVDKIDAALMTLEGL